MTAAVPVLILVALAGCHRVFSASLEVASREDVSDGRVDISELQNSEELMKSENCFKEAVRDQPEQKLNPTVSSVSEEITQGTETQSTKEEQTEDMTDGDSDEADEGTEARAEVRPVTLKLVEEDSYEAEEQHDIQVLKHAGESDMVTE